LIGFQSDDPVKAELVTRSGLVGHTSEQTPGCVYELMARGEFVGSLIHSPNIYDFPVSMQIARLWGGDAVWVDTREPVHLGQTWLDERAAMRRLPRIVACSWNRSVLEHLCELAADWDPVRYRAC
jgi:3'(2'), 5'-bisphosphate nucleotidase